MRLAQILLAASMTLSVHQVPVTASVGSDVALANIMSLGFLLLVGADQSVTDPSRFLRGNSIAEGDKEERGKADDIVNKLLRTESFSALKNVNDLVTLNKISAIADDEVVSALKFADDAGMSPSALAKELKTFRGLDDAFIEKAVQAYTERVGKNVD